VRKERKREFVLELFESYNDMKHLMETSGVEKRDTGEILTETHAASVGGPRW